jgi:hypothetical protein
VAHAIFISYRRDDSEGEAGRLFDDLTRAFGGDAVFMDVSGIDPGIDFRKAIDDNVACCGVLLAMIGPTWATIAGADGQRRLDNTNDYVRLEIASALSRNIPVIPVLVHDARMPHADQLPDNLKDLAYRNSVEITHARWNSDVQLLIQALAQYVHATKATEADTVHAQYRCNYPRPTHFQKPLLYGLNQRHHGSLVWLRLQSLSLRRLFSLPCAGLEADLIEQRTRWMVDGRILQQRNAEPSHRWIFPGAAPSLQSTHGVFADRRIAIWAHRMRRSMGKRPRLHGAF